MLVFCSSFSGNRNKTDFEPNYCEPVNKCTDKGFTRSYYIVFFVCLNEQIAAVNRGPFERVAMGTDRPSTSSFHMFGQHEKQYAN